LFEGDLTDSAGDVTGLLQAWSAGDVAARDALFAALYQELHRRAANRMRREDGRHLLQPTALINEAYLRLVDQNRVVWQNRAHFLAVASQTMRRILVDQARRRKMAKRSGQWVKLTLDDAIAPGRPPAIDVLDLDDALLKLSAFDRRKSRIAELRFFGGLSTAEAGHVLAVSTATAEREWRAARAWLVARLTGRHPR
jgi:RNA polymerase sigma factor (TIGR02999 family)